MQQRFYKSPLLLCFLVFFTNYYTLAQCTIQQTDKSATIFIPVDANLQYEGMPLPIGSEILVLFDNNGILECAGSVIWNEENAAMTVFGDDGEANGLAEGELYIYQIVLPGGCIISDVQVTYLTGSIFDQTNTYTEDGISGLATFQSFLSLDIQETIANDTCNLGIGSIEVLGLNGQLPYVFEWGNGAQTPALTDLNSNDYSVTITDNSGCTNEAVFTIENEDCPEIEANGMVNQNPFLLQVVCHLKLFLRIIRKLMSRFRVGNGILEQEQLITIKILLIPIRNQEYMKHH